MNYIKKLFVKSLHGKQIDRNIAHPHDTEINEEPAKPLIPEEPIFQVHSSSSPFSASIEAGLVE